jgi:hypothetical protein
MPGKLKDKLIAAFKRNPKAILGITKIHFVIHGIKILKKYHLIALILPFVAASLILNLLPEYLLWAIFTGSTGYLGLLIARKFKRKPSNHERREQ